MEESNKDCPNLDGIKVRAPKEICGAFNRDTLREVMRGLFICGRNIRKT